LIENKKFLVGLISLPLSQLDVILKYELIIFQ